MSLESNFSVESFEPAELLSKPLQLMTVRKIDLKKLTVDYVKDHNMEEEPHLELLAKYIIDKYNDRRLQLDQKEQQTNFVINELDDDHFGEIERKGYSVVHSHCPVIVKSSISCMLKSLNVVVHSSCCVSHLFFFFRKIDNLPEMFALCSGTRGYVPTVEYTDYSFPRSIACRLLNPASRSKQSTKSLCGHVISSQEFLRCSQLYDPHEIQKLYSNFTARLREDASIMALDDFRTKTGKIPKNGPEMEIQEGGIRIRKQLSLKCYFLVFNQFSKICRGKATYTCTNDKEALEKSSRKVEQDDHEGFAFLYFYSPVPYATKCKLDNEVLQTIKNCYHKIQFHSWELCHSKTNDYFGALEHRLKYSNKNGEKVIDKWPYGRRSYEEIICLLRTLKFRKYLINASNTFEEEIGNISIGFYDGSKWVDEKLSKCLSGQLEHEFKVYFKCNARWYETSEDLHYKINCEFKECMMTSLINPEDVGYLSHPWEPKNELTVKSLSQILGLAETYVKDILEKKVSFIDISGIVYQKELRGEILLVPEVNYFKEEIERFLQQPCIDKVQLENSFGVNIANTIFDHLAKSREVGRIFNHKKGKKGKNKDLVEVKNAFFPEKLGFGMNRFTKQQMENWQSAEQAFLWKMDEEEYNQTYLFDSKNIDGFRQPYSIDQSGWIVGDQILPDGIELFDVMYYTPSTLYLYHVKESFGQKTRDACSQIRNSCSMINNAVSSNHDGNILEKFHNLSCTATKSEYRERVKEQMDKIDRVSFQNLFRNKKINIVFVYAFVDARLEHHVIKKAKKTHFTPEDFSFVKESKAKDIQNEKIFEELISQGYLNENGERTQKVDELNVKNKLSFKDTLLNSNININKVWQVLTGDLSYFKSLIGRMEVLYTQSQVKGLGYGFKICQIQRPSHKSPSPAVSIWKHKELRDYANNWGKAIKKEKENDSSM